MDAQEILYTIALTRLHNLSLHNTRILYDKLGSASAVYAHRKEIKGFFPDATDLLVNSLQDWDEALSRAEEELRFMEKGHITGLCRTDKNYPHRLKECDDAPLVLFYKGNADLNTSRIISMVGTRRCTEYGREICRSFIKDLRTFDPHIVIVSGLAYGIDIASHQSALANHLNTVGVLAHGLDMIYPTKHRPVAVEMVKQGGLLTEYMSRTNADKVNFVRRNRIVAGIADVTVVVESASKGGSLITAGIAESYHRDCFAFPGRVSDTSSAGCNALISQNKAGLIQSASDMIQQLGWDDLFGQLTQQETPQSVYEKVSLSDEERLIVNLLERHDNYQINDLTVRSGIPYARLSALLFELEIKGVVKALAGGVYRLVRLG